MGSNCSKIPNAFIKQEAMDTLEWAKSRPGTFKTSQIQLKKNQYRPEMGCDAPKWPKSFQKEALDTLKWAKSRSWTFKMGQIQLQIPQNRPETGSKGPTMAQILPKRGPGYPEVALRSLCGTMDTITFLPTYSGKT